MDLKSMTHPYPREVDAGRTLCSRFGAFVTLKERDARDEISERELEKNGEPTRILHTQKKD